MKKSFSFLLYHIDLVLSLALGLFLFWGYTQHSGLGISPDSVAYLSTAEHLLALKGAVDFSGEAFVLFPLGYPFFLALVLCLSPLATGITLLLCHAALWVLYLLLLRNLLLSLFPHTPWLRWGLLLLAAGSTALLEVFTMVWSESLFLVCIMLFFHAAQKQAQTPSSRSKNNWFWAMALWCGLALFTRFAGISLLCTGLLLINRQCKTWWLFLGLSSLPLALNLLRNQVAAQQLAGVRQVANQPMGEKATEMGMVLQAWLPLESIPAMWLGWAWVILAMVVLLQNSLRPWSPFKTIALFWAVYSLFIFALSSLSRFEALSNRLLIPAFVPFLVLVFKGMEAAWDWAKAQPFQGWKTALAFGLLALFLRMGAQQYQAQSETWEGVWYAGIPGYTEDMWRGSALWQHLQKNPLGQDKTVYTNAREAYYMGTRRNAQAIPHKDIAAEKTAYQKQRNIYLVWFFNGENPDLVAAPEAMANRKIISLFQFQDGWVAELSP